MNNTAAFCYISLNQIHYSLKKAFNVDKSLDNILKFMFQTGEFIVYICFSFLMKIITNL
ncbi:hypothetical protein Flavo103_13350 [Flavobacterium collinsii]|uniref:Uncharacterized protein n=1 Tax=Flavobacterium collinsii TaxID=1114861 RepID=A0ABM8KH25_9FLAO|nr:hypothetical protein Flavo103_13350 [Flavobacterium collinsii]CAA9197496.1 hypothetical protein FLACOL7796_01707 [Flavobacterium collinsii]